MENVESLKSDNLNINTAIAGELETIQLIMEMEGVSVDSAFQSILDKKISETNLETEFEVEEEILDNEKIEEKKEEVKKSFHGPSNVTIQFNGYCPSCEEITVSEVEVVKVNTKTETVNEDTALETDILVEATEEAYTEDGAQKLVEKEIISKTEDKEDVEITVEARPVFSMQPVEFVNIVEQASPIPTMQFIEKIEKICEILSVQIKEMGDKGSIEIILPIGETEAKVTVETFSWAPREYNLTISGLSQEMCKLVSSQTEMFCNMLGSKGIAIHQVTISENIHNNNEESDYLVEAVQHSTKDEEKNQ